MRRLSFTMLALAAACGGKAEPAKSAEKAAAPLAEIVRVETAAVEHQKMPRFLTLTGSLQADRSSQTAANVAGYVTATYVERGQPVRRGQVLAAVDSKAAGLQAAAAAAQSKAADTQVELARQDCERADKLFREGALAKAEYDRQKTHCTAQLYNANAMQAQADLAGKLAGDTIIRAPMDGIIGERFVNVGEYVQPASRVASIFSIDPVRVSISVPESAVGLVKPGQTLELEVSAYPGKKFPATVRFISPTLRAMTRDLIVEAFAENKERMLMPGMFCTVLLQVGEEEQPTVPAHAIRADGTIRRLFLAREGAAYEMVVRTGVERDGRVSVLEPIAANERVIVNPPPGLHDGSAIQ